MDTALIDALDDLMGGSRLGKGRIFQGPPTCRRQRLVGDCYCCTEAENWWHDVLLVIENLREDAHEQEERFERRSEE